MNHQKRLSIVVCDDDPFALRVITSLLKAAGQDDVMTFDSSTACYEYLAQNPVTTELLLCDLQMPNMDGIELMNRLSDIGFAGMVALISGEDSRVLKATYGMAQSKKLTMVSMLEKPISRTGLQELIAKACVQSVGLPAQLKGVGHVATVAAEQISAGLNAGQFVPFFQPKVRFSDKHLMGFEALVRWIHPTRGVLAPASFLDVIESENLTDQLLWNLLLSEFGILNWMEQWREQGLGFSVAVNLSDANLLDASLPRRLYEEVRKLGLGPKDLLLEISENRSGDSRNEFVGNLLRLSLNGFGLSLDDFGTGQASMQDLKDLPLTELKFDRSYVTGVQGDSTKQHLMTNCIAMAKSLGIRTVAEGVETDDEWTFLKEAGCELAQGYLVARPIPASEVVAWSKHWNEQHSPAYTSKAPSESTAAVYESKVFV